MIFFAVFLCHIEPTCQKSRFYNQIVNFAPWAPFALFKRAPELIKNENFQKLQFLLFYFVTLSLLTNNHVSIISTTAFSPFRPIRAH